VEIFGLQAFSGIRDLLLHEPYRSQRRIGVTGVQRQRPRDERAAPIRSVPGDRVGVFGLLQTAFLGALHRSHDEDQEREEDQRRHDHDEDHARIAQQSFDLEPEERGECARSLGHGRASSSPAAPIPIASDAAS
jgi:hypothetical protein